jgi:hypothetical protein
VLDENAVAKAHAVYTPFTLSIYDMLVHGLSNRFAWRCPTRRLIALYRDNLSSHHLEAGVGTGFMLDRVGTARLSRLVLLDANRNCLDRAGRRLARFKPELHQVNLLAPLALDLAPVDSVGLTYVLHCLPGRMSEKLKAIDHLRPLMSKGATLFGATILGRGIAPNGRLPPCSISIMQRACSIIARTTWPPCPTACGNASMRSQSRKRAASPCFAPPDQGDPRSRMAICLGMVINLPFTLPSFAPVHR